MVEQEATKEEKEVLEGIWDLAEAHAEGDMTFDTKERGSLFKLRAHVAEAVKKAEKDVLDANDRLSALLRECRMKNTHLQDEEKQQAVEKALEKRDKEYRDEMEKTVKSLDIIRNKAVKEAMGECRKISELFYCENVALLEDLASLEHEQWMKWAKTIMEKENISKERTMRWATLFVDYSKLSNESKEHDRIWAYKVLEVVRKHDARWPNAKRGEKE